MLPRTHAFIIERALGHPGHPWRHSDLEALLEGNRDEDDWVLLGLRLRAPGLTHTYRPARPRFGELLAPSAKDGLLRCASRAAMATDRRRAAWWLGRACHLLGDMSVPARVRGVWHLAGDPLESWLEARPDTELLALAPAATVATARAPEGITEALARAAAHFLADTTRTPWGAALHRLAHRGQKLDEAEVQRQARELVPLAIRATADLLASVPPRL